MSIIGVSGSDNSAIPMRMMNSIIPVCLALFLFSQVCFPDERPEWTRPLSRHGSKVRPSIVWFPENVNV
jgi:hypothetical protein